MQLEQILVPYDVDQEDTGMARSPRALLDLGFDEALKQTGLEVRSREVWSRVESGKAGITASVTRQTARAVALAGSRGRFPLVLSGGCLSAVGVAHGLQRMGRDFGVLWVDAHGDFNTEETTPTGYWDGMALGALCGRSLAQIYKAVELVPVPVQRIVHVGGRALDPPEIEDFERLNVSLVSPSAVGQAGAIQEIKDTLDRANDLYLHVDLDGLDPAAAPAVNLPEPDGVLLDDLLACIGQVKRPLALTLAGMNFDKADEDQARLQMETCVQLVKAALLE